MDKDTIYQQVAELHAASIDQGFLATLGIPFLSLLYQAIDESDSAVLLVEQRDGRIIGFVSGGIGMRQIYRRMLHSPYRLARTLVPSVVRPTRLRRILEILSYGDANADSSLMQTAPRAELLSIAVAPDARGQGVAERLYRQLMRHFSSTGEHGCRIVVGNALAPAHRFYKRMGAQPAGHIQVHHGEGSVLYVQRFN